MYIYFRIRIMEAIGYVKNASVHLGVRGGCDFVYQCYMNVSFVSCSLPEAHALLFGCDHPPPH